MKKSDMGSRILRDLLNTNEERANLFLSRILSICGAMFLVSWIITYRNTYRVSIYAETVVYFSAVILSILVGFVLIQTRPGAKYTRYVMEGTLLIVSSVIYIYGIDLFWCFLLVPVFASVRYFDVKFSVAMGVLSWIAMLCATGIKNYMGYYQEHVDLAYVFVPNMTFLAVKDTLVQTLLEKGFITISQLRQREILLLLGRSLMLLPIVFSATAFAKAGREMITESAEKARLIDAAKTEVEKAKVGIMLSQLQPHFLYNSLSAIMAIDDNPPETMEALSDFADYLRGNLNSLNADEPVEFARESAHIEHYVALEKLRFGDKLHFETDIQTTDFSLPVLTVQMIVENAVKHGISPKPTGGTVRLSTREDDEGYYITVSDDGVGFDPERLDMTDRTHVGVANSKSRIESLGGTMEIESAVNQGTTVKIFIPGEDESE